MEKFSLLPNIGLPKGATEEQKEALVQLMNIQDRRQLQLFCIEYLRASGGVTDWEWAKEVIKEIDTTKTPRELQALFEKNRASI